MRSKEAQKEIEEIFNHIRYGLEAHDMACRAYG